MIIVDFKIEGWHSITKNLQNDYGDVATYYIDKDAGADFDVYCTH